MWDCWGCRGEIFSDRLGRKGRESSFDFLTFAFQILEGRVRTGALLLGEGEAADSCL